ncbi:MAG: DUF2190 family protein [Alphaproteobacteria bacterium]|nr:DUF2190 family protein [Alphaproteobacteria bacterium]
MKQTTSFNYLAEAAITANAVVIAGTADNEVDMPGAADVAPWGVALEAAAIGESVDVQRNGYAIVIANAAITKGDFVAISGTDGRVAGITIGTTTHDQRLVGRAMQAASGAGAELSIELMLGQLVTV